MRAEPTTRIHDLRRQLKKVCSGLRFGSRKLLKKVLKSTDREPLRPPA